MLSYILIKQDVNRVGFKYYFPVAQDLVFVKVKMILKGLDLCITDYCGTKNYLKICFEFGGLGVERVMRRLKAIGTYDKVNSEQKETCKK